MAPLFEPFLSAGIWVVVLGVLSWIAYARRPSIEDEAARYVAALSEPWLMRMAVVLGLLAWAWSFGRIFFGRAYLVGSGSFPELSTALLGLILVLSGVAWLGIRSGTRFHPWLTYGVFLSLILLSGAVVVDAPEAVLSQEAPDEERRAVAFVQRRLISLNCFEAAGELEPTIDAFDTPTYMAVISFQQANKLTDSDRDISGVVRPRVEFRLLARPFPFLLGPRPCSDR
ncbi:MAG TPA: hypothetical protein VN493_24245 [Thermoanaerobaculia bacterium]|nr:hypothetical protein [Thermoanaerobaculia bacterium]